MTRAAKALGHLGEVDPALAVLALWCEHRDGEGETRTRGNTIIYGPSFVSFGLPEQVGLVAHHVLHVALRHSARMAGLRERLGAGFDPHLFGLAADSIVNETLLLAGHALPRPALRLTDLLNEIGEPARSEVEALQAWDTDRLAMALHADPSRARAAREHGERRGFVEDLTPSGSGEEDEAQSSADWRNHLLRAMEAGRKAGTGIGLLGAILADMSAPQVPWEVQLRGVVSKALTQTPRHSHRRPSRQWLALASQAARAGTEEPVCQPGLVRDMARPRVVVGLDTSSSIDPLTLSLFCAEVEGVSRRSGAEAHLLAFDEKVHTAYPLDAEGWRGLRTGTSRTGGGTDFAPVYAAATRLDPSVLIMLTDLDAEVGTAPPYPVIWAVPGRVGAPPFGRVLQIGG